MQTGLWQMELFSTVLSLTNVGVTFGLPETTVELEFSERAYRQVCGQRGRNVTVMMAISPINGFVPHSAIVGSMNAPRFNEFLTQARQRLNPDEHVVFIYDGAPAHRSADNPGETTELKMLVPHSPFLNIVEQAISSFKVAIKTDVSRPEIQAQMRNRGEARRQGIALVEYRQQLLLTAHERNVGTITTHAQMCPVVPTYADLLATLFKWRRNSGIIWTNDHFNTCRCTTFYCTELYCTTL